MALDDAFQWNNTALHFLHGKGFLTNTENLDPKRPPIYPLFMAANYWLFGEQNFTSVKISQAILGSVTCLGILAIGSLLFNPVIGFWTGIVCAVYPPLIVYSEILQSETLFIFLLTVFLWIWILAERKNQWLFYMLAGFLLGLCNLCRGSTLFFPLFILGFAFWIPRIRIQWSKYLALIAISFAVIAPWTWRNYKVYNMFLPIVYGGPEQLWYGTLPLRAQREIGDSEEFKQLQVPPTVKEAEKFYTDMAVQNVLKDPLGYAWLSIKKFIFFWYKPVGHELIDQKSVLLGWLAMGLHFALIFLFVNGIILTRFKKEELFPLYLTVSYIMMLHTLLLPMPRYRLPIEPLMTLFAIAGLGAWEFSHQKRKISNVVS
jgi:4-amino-4-deoxy-L-arabinose transferase-like glycosyltransferase